ncbi:hypothetical protein LTR56_028089, partial [Elasticomyces elasticus]
MFDNSAASSPRVAYINSASRIMKVSDAEFDALVEAVDRFEGDRVRSISERSLLIVNMLFDDCDDGAIMTFRMESFHDDSIIIQESRCSPGLAAMLLPYGETDPDASM